MAGATAAGIKARDTFVLMKEETGKQATGIMVKIDMIREPAKNIYRLSGAPARQRER
jgi:hypothetical protein